MQDRPGSLQISYMFMDALKRLSLNRAVLFVLITIMPVLLLTAVFDYSKPNSKKHLVGFSCNEEGCFTVEIEEAPPSIVLEDSEIDLTGDGLPEKVIFEEGRLTVYDDGVMVWQSNPFWQVVDFALGDPNDDGRNEIMVALWKPDDEDIMRSHPFIIGFRGGRYKTIWGGSAVAYGIHELLLADLDGSGRQELIVLDSASHKEGPGASLRTLSVWDWHGWGFSLRWRSEEGYYSNLGLIPSIEDSAEYYLVVEQND